MKISFIKHLYVAVLLLAMPILALSQGKITVRGTVTSSEDGSTVIGAGVMIKGTSQGVVTDIDGKFIIDNVPSNAVLEVNMISFAVQDIQVNSRTEINVVLKPDAQLLDQVVVIGYGSVKKNDLTGSVTIVKVDEITKGAVTSADQMIQGKTPGLFVMPGDGGPGSAPTIRIRGGASLNASNNPLIIIDGVPIAEDATPGAANPLATINPNDIEAFTVLKDASATAIYGSRASNGVIIITTKRGTQKGIKVNYAGTFSINDAYQRINTMSPDEFYRVVNDIAPDLSNGTRILEELNRYPGQRTNWQDLVLQTGIAHDHNITASGKAGILPYRVSIGYNNEKGTVRTSKFDRFTGSLKLNPKFFDDHLSVDINLKGTLNNNIFADGGAVSGAAFFDPTKPTHSTDVTSFNTFWNYGDRDLGTFNSLAPLNPLSQLYDAYNESKVKRSIGNIQLDYKMPFLPELRANLNLGYDVAENDQKGGVNNGSFQAFKDDTFKDVGRRTEKWQLRRNQLLDFYLNYNKYFEGIKSNIDLMGGYSYQHFYRSDLTRTFSNTTSDVFAADKDTWTFNNDLQRYERIGEYILPTESFIVSLFSRLNYTFMERYLFTATIRRDGSSRFSPDYRYGVFPSVAFAWKIIDESFMKNQSVLNDLKLRLGYGVTGQQEFGDNYGYIPRYTIGTNPASTYLGSFLIRPDRFIPTLKWEETATKNIGFDFALLKNRISGSVDYYRKDTKDLLNMVNVPAGTNFSNKAFANVGDMYNQGLEININASPIETKDLSWNMGFNVTFNSSKITNLTIGNNPDYPGQNEGDPGYGTGSFTQKLMVGYAPYTFYLYQQVYDLNGKPLQNIFVDRNGDGQISEADRYLTDKSPMPKTFMGFNTTLRYKEFDFGFILRANLGNYVFNGFAANNSSLYTTMGSNFLNNKYRGVLETGFRDNNENPQRFSDHFLENASFLRMDNISAGYNFKNVLKSGIDGRLSFSVQNVFTLTKYSGLDPEVSNNGVDKGMWPRPRMYSLGLNLNF